MNHTFCGQRISTRAPKAGTCPTAFCRLAALGAVELTDRALAAGGLSAVDGAAMAGESARRAVALAAARELVGRLEGCASIAVAASEKWRTLQDRALQSMEAPTCETQKG